MSATRQYSISTGSLHQDTLVALLADLPFNSFESDENQVKAYLAKPDDSELVEASVRQLAERFNLQVTIETLPDINYNALWEEAYSPVEIDDFLLIRAPFHEKGRGFKHELEIIPEMSFGTGHHETTYLMAQLLKDYPPFGKTCFDFGTGTGVLALVAKMQGASYVIATDIDQRCVDSTQANAQRNNILIDEIRLGTQESFPEQELGLILANINRNVLLESISDLANLLSPAGELWMSGILVEDQGLIGDKAIESGLTHLETRQRKNWIACMYLKGA